MYKIELPITRVYDDVHIRDVTHAYNNQKYMIINYCPSTSDDNFSEKYGKYRSVIINPISQQIVGFSPPTSLSFNGFIERFSPSDSFIIEELVDGIMINVAWDTHINNWIVSTKRTVDAANSFIKLDEDTPSMLFSNMFNDSMNQHMISLDSLSRQYLYSFVMRHPANRIVTPVIKPILYLVRVYEIQKDNADEICETSIEDIDTEYTIIQQTTSYFINEIDIREYNSDGRLGFLGTVYFPKQITPHSDATLESIYDNYLPEYGYQSRGLSIYCKETGMRTSINNPQYDNVSNISGNISNLEHKYIALLQSNSVQLYLYYYPEHTSIFNMFCIRIKRFVSQLHMAYMDCFINKRFHTAYLSKPFRHHLFELHNKYKTELRPLKLSITYNIVEKYVLALQYYSLSHSMRSDWKN